MRLFLGVFAIIILLASCQEKSGFVNITKVYEGFEGKVALEKEVIALENRQDYVLDSLLLHVKLLESKVGIEEGAKENYGKAVNQYQRVMEEFNQISMEKKQVYNERIWEQINTYMKEYGKKEGYTYIHGADGSGALMYADSTKDITNSVLKFINDKYNGL